jgi:ribosomal protein L37AE/L43A
MKTYKIKIDGKEHEVLGCPFCGEKPVSRTGIDIGCSHYDCEAHVNTYGRTHLFLDNSEAVTWDAIRRWNKRAS